MISWKRVGLLTLLGFGCVVLPVYTQSDPAHGESNSLIVDNSSSSQRCCRSHACAALKNSLYGFCNNDSLCIQ